jgi:oxalate decarboxylase/phosphoglucose isomerase-like protein (cupin superfamily)
MALSADLGQLEPWQELGTDLLVNEPHVRCWIETVPPGEQRPAHTHRHPWVTIVLSGAHGDSFDADGRLIKSSRLETGQVIFNPPDRLPYRHFVRNTSQDTLVMVAIEIRDDASRHEEQHRPNGSVA